MLGARLRGSASRGACSLQAAGDRFRSRAVDHGAPTSTLSYADAAKGVASMPFEHFESHLVKKTTGTVILWNGDAGYATRDADLPGPRHRLLMRRGPWRYERSPELGKAAQLR